MDASTLIELISATGQVGTGGLIAFGLWWIWSDRIRWWKEWEATREERGTLRTETLRQLSHDRSEIIEMWKQTSNTLSRAVDALQTNTEIVQRLLDVLGRLEHILAGYSAERAKL